MHVAEQVRQRLLLHPQARRAGDPQLLDPLRPAHGELRRDPAAQADAAQDHLVQAQRVEQLDVVKRHVLDGVDLVEAAALAEAGMRRH